MPLGAGLQLQAVSANAIIAPVDLHIPALVIGAGQPFWRAGRLSNWLIVLAGKHLAIAAQCLLVESSHLFLAVRSGVRNRPNPQLPFAKAQVHIGTLVFVVRLNRLGAGIHRQPQVCSRSLVGVYMHSAKWRIHLDILLHPVGILVHMNPASRHSSRQRQAGHKNRQVPYHGNRPLPRYTPASRCRFPESNH